MGVTSDSDDEIDDYDWDADETKPALVRNAANGALSRGCTSNGVEKHDSGWESDEEELFRAHDAVASSSKEASEAGPSHTNWTAHFVAMGFPKELVTKAINQNREGDSDGVLETLLAYGATEESPKHEVPDEHFSASGDDDDDDDDDDVFEDDFFDTEDLEFEYLADDFSEKDKMVSTLVDMGYLAEEASSAIDRCGASASILELVDSIRAAQMQEEPGDHFWNGDYEYFPCRGQNRSSELGRKNKRVMNGRRRESVKRVRLNCDDLDLLVIPKPMVGYGVPCLPSSFVTHRELPDTAIGRPYFYYENVALAPKGVWDTISRFLYDIRPEFVDSKYFCAAARKRGYIHNLPLKNRVPLLPIPPKTIKKALPATEEWWPTWDLRTQLNCLQTCTASAKLVERIRYALSQYDGKPPDSIQKWVLEECRKWNLVWIGHNKVAPLEPDEVEMLLGFPKNHTRGISRTERYRSLGNSFQIDTVAFHLSVLKDMFPNGMNVLSLFSGIGGAEVALHRIGICLKVVVSVELSETNRNIVRSWWDQTNQKGVLIDMADVQQLNDNRLKHFIDKYGGFDLVIGGSPCNNLAGSNRHHRDGLEGEHSSLFYDYFRILDNVRCIMGAN